MPTFSANWATSLLRSMLRSAVSSGYTVDGIYLIDSGNTMRRYKLVSGSAWDAAASGAIALAGVPTSTTASSAGTLAGFTLAMPSDGSAIRSTSPGAATSSPGEIILSSLNASDAVQIQQFRIGLPKARGTVQMNVALRNALVEVLVGKRATHLSANGTIKVYSGSAPDVEAAATGTELWSCNVDTTSAFSWSDAASSACALAGSLTATSNAFGANQVVGYARLAWTHNSVNYVIQGSVGEGAGDFQFTNLDGGSSNEMQQSTSYSINNATIGF